MLDEHEARSRKRLGRPDVRATLTCVCARHGAALVLGAAFLIFFGPHLFSADVPYYRDHLITNIPMRQFLYERLRAGEFPQWYPYESLGVPVIGQIALGTFHPLMWGLFWLPAAMAEKLALLATYLVGLIGAYRLARLVSSSRSSALVAAIAFGFGGYALGVSSILTYATSQATLPWVFWAALRVGRHRRAKDAALLGLVWSLVFLAGDAIGFLFCGASLLVSLLERPGWRTTGWLLTGGLLASLLCGIELLPATKVAAESVRNVGEAGPNIGRYWALHPLRLPELIAAGWVPDEVRYRVTRELFGGGSALFATTLFAGGVVVLLAAVGVAKRQRLGLAFAALGALALWMALGDFGGLLPLLRKLVPLFSKFRYPERYLAFFWLALGPLVALGVDAARAQPRRLAHLAALLAVFLGVVAVVIRLQGFAEAAWIAAGRTLAPGDPVPDMVDRAWASGLGWTAFALALAAALFALWPRLPRPALLLAALVFLELWRGNGEHLPLVRRELLEKPNAFHAALHTSAPHEPRPRVVEEPAPPFENRVLAPPALRERWVRGMTHLLRPDAAGLHAVTPLKDNLGATSVRNHLLVAHLGKRLPGVATALNACYRVGGQRTPSPNERELARENELGLSLIESECLPRAFLAGARTAATRDEALALLEQGGFNPSTVVWERGPSLGENPGQVRWKKYSPERLELEVAASGPAALVVTDEFAPGWRATVDGQEVSIYSVWLAVRGVEMPQGIHTVVFEYRTPRLALGLLSTFLGLSAAGLLAAVTAWRERCLRPRAR